IAWYAVPSTTSSAKLLIAIALTFFCRIVFLLRMGLSVRPSSACSHLPPALLTCLHQFVHVRRRTYLENVAVRQRRMLADELYRMIHVPRLKDENATELFLGFRIGAVGGCHSAVLPRQGQGGFCRLERFSSTPVPV